MTLDQLTDSNGSEIARRILSASAKTTAGIQLDADETEIVKTIEAAIKEMNRGGMRSDDMHLMAQFIQSVVQRDIENIPEEALAHCFDEMAVGANDVVEPYMLPEDTFVAYEAAHGGNVPASYLNIAPTEMKTKNLQVETYASFRSVSANPWKSISAITEYAGLALRGAMFRAIFADLDAKIPTSNTVVAGASFPTQAEADELAQFAFSQGLADSAIIARAKYIFPFGGFAGASDAALNDAYARGVPGLYRGVRLIPVRETSSMKQNQLFPDNRIYAVAGKIGTLVTRGEISTAVDADNNTDQFHFLFKNFTFEYGFSDPGFGRIEKMTLPSA
jgi:hypothetical protein